jgi:4'-phosphopantetheinyl transferase
MNGDCVAPDDFVQAATRACVLAGFVPPGVGEACVLVIDSARWTTCATVAESLLDTGERERAARFRFDRDRRDYLLAHAWWRIVLGSCVAIDPAAVPLVSLPSGQPKLSDIALSTSLSHSAGWVAIAVADAVTVGVDIERSPSRMPLDGLLSTICTPAEVTEMAKLSAPAREAALLALWTRKEALLKAFGTGLREPLSTLSACTTDPVEPPPASGLPACRVSNLDLPEGLVGALAVPSSARLYRLVMP